MGLALALVSLANAADDALTLVARAGDTEWREFLTENGEITVLDPLTRKRGPIPAGTTWRLEGDLQRNASFFRYSPNYQVQVLPPGEMSSRPRVLAVVKTDPTSWASRDLRNAIVACVWMVDGKPAIVSAVASTASATRYYAAIQAIELDARTAKGYPLILVFSRNEPKAPKPLFSRRPAQYLLELMHFGSPSEFAQAIPQLTSLDVQSPNGMNLLDIAAEAGLETAVDVLLKSGAKHRPQRSDRYDTLYWPVARGRLEVVTRLIAESPKIPPSIMRAAIAARHLEVAQLLAPRASPNTAGRLLAELGMVLDRADVVKSALSISAEGAEGIPSWGVARSIRRQNGVLKMLLENGVDANLRISETPLLHIAAQAENETALHELLSAGANPSDIDGRRITALVICAQRGFTAGARRLLNAGANVLSQGGEGDTALHHAALNGHLEIVELLLAKGGRLDVRDDHGLLPLEQALRSRAPAIVRAMVTAGGRLDHRQAHFGEMLLHAIALDEVELLQRAELAGWQPRRVRVADFTLAEIAGLFGSAKIQSHLSSADPGTRADIQIERSPEVVPRALKGNRPADPRPSPPAQRAVAVQVSGIVSETGAFLFPRLDRYDDPLITRAVIQATSSWRFAPALNAGRPVKAGLMVTLKFDARDPHVYEPREVERPPVIAVSARMEPGTIARDSITQSTVETEVRQTTGPDGMPVFTEYDVNRLLLTPVFEERRGESAVVSFVVEPNGRASHAMLVNTVRQDLAARALAALSKYRFEPGIRGGIPVRTALTLVIEP